MAYCRRNECLHCPQLPVWLSAQLSVFLMQCVFWTMLAGVICAFSLWLFVKMLLHHWAGCFISSGSATAVAYCCSNVRLLMRHTKQLHVQRAGHRDARTKTSLNTTKLGHRHFLFYIEENKSCIHISLNSWESIRCRLKSRRKACFYWCWFHC